MPPEDVLNITCSEIESEGILKNICNWVWETCIVHTSNVATFVTHIYNLSRMTNRHETFRYCQTNIPLSSMKVSNLYTNF